MDRKLFEMKLAAMAEQIALIERDLEDFRQPVDALARARDNVRTAARGLVELAELFNDGTGPSPATRECLACGKTGLAAATRCGFCWTKIVHAADG